MKYLPKYTWRLICCQECKLPGLTLTRKGGKIKGKPTIYVHQNELMCEIAKLRHSIEKKVRKTRGNI